MRDSFVFYKSYVDAIKDAEMNDEEELAFYRALTSYALSDEDLSDALPRVCKGSFSIAKKLIAASNEKYDTAKRRAEGGRKGGRPRKDEGGETPSENLDKNLCENLSENLDGNLSQNLDGNHGENPTVTVTVTDTATVTDTVTVNDTQKEKSVMTKKENRGEKGIVKMKFDGDAYNAFMDEFNIQPDPINHALLAEMDFKALSVAYRMSANFLQQNPQARFLSWVVRNYEKIVNGYYTDKSMQRRRTSGDMVMDTLEQLNRHYKAEEAIIDIDEDGNVKEADNGDE